MGLHIGGWRVHRVKHTNTTTCEVCADSRRDYGIRQGHLEMVCSGSPSAYCKVRVVGEVDNLCERMVRARGMRRSTTIDTKCVRKCFVARNEQLWLSSQQTNYALSPYAFRVRAEQWDKAVHTLQGPAYSHGFNDEIEHFSTDHIVTLMCCGPLSCMKLFYRRQRSAHWPNRHTMEKLTNIPGMLVCTGHKLFSEEDQKLQFRFSFSTQEQLLARDMPQWVKQGYIAFKYTIKTHLDKARQFSIVSAGRRNICSYHLKTVLLWTLERPDAWKKPCPFYFMMLLLEHLNAYLQPQPPFLPHYFLPECNLLETTDTDDVYLALCIIYDIQQNPVTAIINAPTSPGQLYGGGEVVGKRQDIWEWLLLKFNMEGIGASPAEILTALKTLGSRGPDARPFRWLMLGCVLARVDRFREWHHRRLCRVDWLDDPLTIGSQRLQPRRLVKFKAVLLNTEMFDICF